MTRASRHPALVVGRRVGLASAGHPRLSYVVERSVQGFRVGQALAAHERLDRRTGVGG